MYKHRHRCGAKQRAYLYQLTLKFERLGDEREVNVLAQWIVDETGSWMGGFGVTR